MTKEEIISTVDNTLTNLANTIPGVATLYQWLTEETDYFTAPASSKYHSNYDGGLVVHSWFVYQAFNGLFREVVLERQTDIILICFLHDLCKVNFYKPYYRNVKEYDQNKWPKNIQDKNIKYDALGKFVWMQEKGYMIDDYFPYGHGEKSVRLIERHMTLPDDMAMAIRYHMGPWQESDKNNVSKVFEKYPLAYMLHVADGYATYILEPQFDKKQEG